MARIFITGSADGLGRNAAEALLADGHDVVVHARSHERLNAVADLRERGAYAVVGDLSDLSATRELTEQVDSLGQIDAVIHNAGAGIGSGKILLPVNVVAPYVLTASMQRPGRLIYLSSGMHRGGSAALDGLDWSGATETADYSDSKLLVTALTMAVAHRWPDVLSNAVDPGWVPTRMGGPNAPDDLDQGHVTQAWLAVSGDEEAMTSGGYWHHQRREDPHPATLDPAFQGALIEALTRHTGIPLR
ncbi:SDR family NAD(P)-dependent oxidoreductase [Granulicoccus sp. GXG6511]|uniref:SDR family NAD(P)-dependent oxidoreductase n=1 Tax=Granulicoccus sp. GXG6511 TaxID=3381351 RepID=UPI003D7D6A8B